jgi:uncharacterized protein YndB with AHSA1/START domain/predicted enzyme related to lactoylglutathione lyase
MKIKLASVLVNDQESALKFYIGVLGFVKMMDAPAGAFRWLTVVSPEGPDDLQLLLEPADNSAAKQYQEAIRRDGIPAISFLVDDIDREYNRLIQKGVTFTMPPTRSPWGIDAVFDDTCGNLIDIHQPVSVDAEGITTTREGMVRGANTTVVAEPKTLSVVITQLFDAPPELVYRAATDPDLIPQWWGPSEYVTIVKHLDVRPGGSWRFVQRDPQGTEYAFGGVYYTVIPAKLTIDTFEFEGIPGHVLMETTVYEAVEGRTRVTSTSVFQSLEDRDGMFRTGMARGAIESGERMARLLERLKAGSA